jgi:DNA polymerase-3 subunit gamma/tau
VLAKEMVGNLSVPALTRAWQILTRGNDEMRHAVNTLATLEMVLVRLGYAAQLPTPAEIVRAGVLVAAPAAIAPSPAPRAAASGGAVHQLSSAVGNAGPRVSTPASSTVMGATAPQIEPQKAIELHSFPEVVELFEAKREAMLAKFLVNDMRLVHFEQGRIEVKPINHIPSDVPARIARMLTESTCARWTFTYNEAVAGEPSIREQRLAAIAKQKEYAMQHPKVQAALEIFPDAEIEFIPQKKS